MNLRLKLTLQFAATVGVLLLVFSFVVYTLSSGYRRNDFYSRLYNRAMSHAKLLVDVSEVDSNLLSIIDDNMNAMYREDLDVYNQANELVYHNGPDSLSTVDLRLVKQVRSQKDYRFNIDGREYLGLSFNSGKTAGYVVICSAYDEFGYRKLSNLRFVLGLGFFIGLGLALVGGYFFAGRALKPISAVVNQVQKITISNLNARVNEGNGKDEIAQLAITFNQMLERLEYAFTMQKSFVSNASHEFRTPISIMRAEIELIMMQERKPEEYVKMLAAIKNDLNRLTRLSNSLLDLAQANLDWSLLKFSALRIDELVMQAKADLNRKSPDYIINIGFKELPDDDKDLTVLGHEYLLGIAFSNLMENACKFSANKTVDLQIACSPGRVSLFFTDAGIGIPLEEQAKIFEPFYRGSNAIDRPGHGLGMSLVKRIVDIHGGNINIESRPGVGTTFQVVLKTKR